MLHFVTNFLLMALYAGSAKCIFGDEPPTTRRPGTMKIVESIIGELFDAHMKRATRLVVEAEVSLDCQFYLSSFASALKTSQPWALRSKYILL